MIRLYYEVSAIPENELRAAHDDAISAFSDRTGPAKESLRSIRRNTRCCTGRA
jgi:hypothetical protein